MDQLEQNTEKLRKLCSGGVKGEYKLSVKEVAFPLTSRCNSYCIMCHGWDKDTEGHIYWPEQFYDLSLEEVKVFLSQGKKSLLDFLRNKTEQDDKPKAFSFNYRETLLSPYCMEIFKYIKELNPENHIRLISNATVPPKPAEIVKYIDRIGFSIDGCTAKTFEYLRPPAKFDHVCEVLKAWDEAADQYNTGFTFGFGTVLSSVSMPELAGIVRMASQYKHFDSMWVTPILLYEQRQYLKSLLLDNMDKTELERCIEEAESMSDQTGIIIGNMDAVRAILNKPFTYEKEQPEQSKQDMKKDYEKSRFCRYMWNGIVTLTEKGTPRYVCCMMNPEAHAFLLKKYGLTKAMNVDKMYNSKGFWRLRQDLLDGKLTEFCKGCSMCNTGYEILSNKPLDLEEPFYV